MLLGGSLELDSLDERLCLGLLEYCLVCWDVWNVDDLWQTFVWLLIVIRIYRLWECDFDLRLRKGCLQLVRWPSHWHWRLDYGLWRFSEVAHLRSFSIKPVGGVQPAIQLHRVYSLPLPEVLLLFLIHAIKHALLLEIVAHGAVLVFLPLLIDLRESVVWHQRLLGNVAQLLLLQVLDGLVSVHLE